MRKFVGGAAVVVASATMMSLMSVGPAQAFTQQELRLCWANTSEVGGINLAVDADGPSFRHTVLGNGECQAWDVRPGQYKITLDDVQAFLNQVQGACPGPGAPDLKIRVKRAGHSYRVYNLSAFLNGAVVTNVRENRATTVSAHLRCV